MLDIVANICDRPVGIADLSKLVVIEIELTSDLKGLKVDVEIKAIYACPEWFDIFLCE
tara:strand:+ start:4797 stop:4970 length:174 start_codon:yes stop_codon:yes gene_type:complete